MGWPCIPGSVPAIHKNLTKKYVITYHNDLCLTDRTLKFSTVTTRINNILLRIHWYLS